MGVEHFISEAEAAQRSGVSVRTLHRFSEAGYLRLQTGHGGERLYDQRELDEIFGAHRDTNPQGQVNSGAEAATNIELHSETHFESPPQDRSSSVTETPHANAAEAIPVAAEQSAEEDTSIYAIEILKLRNVIALQERLLDTKDAEIADLKSQREWLRARVEKLEEKSDRDQILLLSETQTIRKLITLQEQKRSGLRQFLEWVGLAPQPQVKALGTQSEYVNSDTVSTASRTIEVKEAANG
jgi:hypothetical protein